MIAGASKIGRLVSSMLEDDMSVRLIEKSKEKATQIANDLDKTIVLNSDATDIEFLRGENIVNAEIKSIRIDQKEHVIQLFSSLDMEAIELIAEKDSKASRLPVSNLNLPHGCILALVNHNGHIKIPSGDFQIMENDTVLIFCINSKIREVSKIFKSE